MYAPIQLGLVEFVEKIVHNDSLANKVIGYGSYNIEESENIVSIEGKAYPQEQVSLQPLHLECLASSHLI